MEEKEKKSRGREENLGYKCGRLVASGDRRACSRPEALCPYRQNNRDELIDR